MHVLFLLVVAPLFVFLLTWVVATVYRLYFPERPLPLRSGAFSMRRRRAAAGEQVPVGVREIREDQRREDDAPVAYQYAGFPTGQLPEGWVRNLHQRRN